NTEKPSSLSDITTAAGWDIIECDPNSIGPQDIRLVCTERDRGCNQLFEDGEENTIVRLPDNCAGGPFARVVKSWIPEDQSLPARLLKRQLDSPVRALTLDFDFAQIPESNGKVWITASATNSQAQRNALTQSAAKRSLQPLRHASRAGQANAVVRTFVGASKRVSHETRRRRGFFDFVDSAVGTVSDAAKGAIDRVGDVANQVGETVGNVADQAVDTIGDVANQVGDKLNDVGNAIVDGAQDTANAVQDGISNVGDSIGEIIDDATGAVAAFVHAVDGANDFNETISKNLRVLDIHETFPVFSASLNCPAQGAIPAFDTSISVTAAVKAQVDAEVGFIVVGSIVPPRVDDVAFTA
ncbi:110_t:CDS:2, partial [Acaulospora colombiana]